MLVLTTTSSPSSTAIDCSCEVFFFLRNGTPPKSCFSLLAVGSLPVKFHWFGKILRPLRGSTHTIVSSNFHSPFSSHNIRCVEAQKTSESPKLSTLASSCSLVSSSSLLPSLAVKIKHISKYNVSTNCRRKERRGT